jgi:hypothetical protein
MAIRFTNSPNQTFTPYEPGVYDLQIVDVKQGTSRKDNPQLTVKCQIVGGKNDGKQFTTWYSLMENSLWKLAQLVQATGCPHTVVGTDAKGNPVVEFEELDLVGRFFTVDLTVEEYNGKANNRANNERPSAYQVEDEVEEAAPEPAPAPAPAPAPKAAAPQTTTQTMARRPRTVGQAS